MRLAKKAVLFTLGTCLMFLALLPTRQTSAQDGTKLPKSIFIQAQAMGQAQQLGRTFSVNIIRGVINCGRSKSPIGRIHREGE